jgi:hypothetical protein
MKEILDKISSYDFFNHLLPGILFVALIGEFTDYSFTQENLVVGLFVYYFIGLIISRFGSLVIEPILKKISFLKFSGYKDFISASKKDSKIETLSEINNMYRALTAMFLLFGLVKVYELISIPRVFDLYILIVLLFTLFLFSYKKQTEYITKRIKSNRKQA